MWKLIDTVDCFISEDFGFSPTISIFSFIGTIVKKVDKTDNSLNYIYNFNLINDKISFINNNGGSIIVIDSFNSPNIDNIKCAFETFHKAIKCPVIVLFSTLRNKYSKPFTGTWNILRLLYKKQKKTIKKNLSLVIGNRAGRKAKKDKDCSDRAFAHNLEINFTTPEKFFMNDMKFYEWSWCPNMLNKASKEKLLDNKTKVPIIIDEINQLPKSEKYTIIITGSPSCGKTTLSNKIKRKWEQEYKTPSETLSDNILDHDNIILKLHEYLSANKSVIIDLLCSYDKILQIIKKSMENFTPIMIIEIITSFQIVQLLDHIKVQSSTDSKTQVLNKIYWSQYYKKYIKPKYDIPCVRYIEFPLVLNPREEIWMEYSY